MSRRRVLFVCTGNTCRSPMAEALARALARDRGLRHRFGSAGTAAGAGDEASAGAKEAPQALLNGILIKRVALGVEHLLLS